MWQFYTHDLLHALKFDLGPTPCHHHTAIAVSQTLIPPALLVSQFLL